ncbi:hypothetical protein [Devosia sp. Leaf64]|uniref:hypothetical protein n=1 Tax=Devosia sp. Leaf64 TaxID=1736229 RepID=UPI0007123C84|nr:hypothetical protein [Devosia sp. Leaf64]KQN73447.1 hypothetical protein ASE94_06325 [Devosia sp. Leaf64]
MLDAFYPSDEYETEVLDAALKTSRPVDILRDSSLTIAQKRAILASWASDARAVPDAPSLRKLDNGTTLDIDAILDALKQLDNEPVAARPVQSGTARGLRHRRALGRAVRQLGNSWRRDDNDDDPPPAPAAAGIPRLTPSLSGGAAVAAK